MKKDLFVKILTVLKYAITFAIGVFGGSNADSLLNLM